MPNSDTFLNALVAGAMFCLLPMFSGCSDDHPSGYKVERSDLRAFFLQTAPRFGIQLAVTNGLPLLPSSWSYRTQGTELQVLIPGDCFIQISNFLAAAVGPMVNTIDFGSEGLAAYFGTNFPPVICRTNLVLDGRRYTSIDLAGYPGLGRAMRQAANQTVNSLRALVHANASAPQITKFRDVFPAAIVRYGSISRGIGFETKVALHGRYILTMNLPAVFDATQKNILDYEAPTLTLQEITKIKHREDGLRIPIFNQAGERRFSSSEWKKVINANGDFAAINFFMVTNAPIPGCDEFIKDLNQDWEKQRTTMAKILNVD